MDFTEKEKQIALDSWYSCMISMGSIPMDEDLYAKGRKIFFEKYGISFDNKIKTTCDQELAEVKEGYFNLRK